MATSLTGFLTGFLNQQDLCTSQYTMQLTNMADKDNKTHIYDNSLIFKCTRLLITHTPRFNHFIETLLVYKDSHSYGKIPSPATLLSWL